MNEERRNTTQPTTDIENESSTTRQPGGTDVPRVEVVVHVVQLSQQVDGPGQIPHIDRHGVALRGGREGGREGGR
jgi:hypothetical protein